MHPQTALQVFVQAKTDLFRAGAFEKSIDDILNKKILEALKLLKITMKGN